MMGMPWRLLLCVFAKVSLHVLTVASKGWVEKVLLRLHAPIYAAVFNWKAWVQE